jgi:hypothetical protein
MKNTFSRRRALGLTVGSLWLTTAGAIFTALALILIGRTPAWAALTLVLVLTAALLITGISTMRAAKRMPAESISHDLSIRRRFLLVVGLEIFALAIANPLLVFERRFDLLPAANLIIVGVHFLPLASIFRAPRYYALGFLFCGIAALTLIFVPINALWGAALARFATATIACGLVAMAFGAAGIFEVSQSLGKSRTMASHA